MGTNHYSLVNPRGNECPSTGKAAPKWAVTLNMDPAVTPRWSLQHEEGEFQWQFQNQRNPGHQLAWFLLVWESLTKMINYKEYSEVPESWFKSLKQVVIKGTLLRKNQNNGTTLPPQGRRNWAVTEPKTTAVSGSQAPAVREAGTFQRVSLSLALSLFLMMLSNWTGNLKQVKSLRFCSLWSLKPTDQPKLLWSHISQNISKKVLPKDQNM